MTKVDSRKPCPKCQYVRTEADCSVLPGTCPACGIAYNKWQQATSETDTTIAQVNVSVHKEPSLWQNLLATTTFVPTPVDETSYWGRIVLLILFSIWGGAFIWGGVDWESIGSSFLHNVNLPFHEFGHVLFSPFGRFMTILGGSLFQILMPLIAMISFSWQMRDNFAAAIMLWWAGQNMIDVSPYIADAEHRVLPLILGLGDEYHDWGNLLTMLDCVESAGQLATAVYLCGSLTILLALYWAGWILLRQRYLLANNNA